MAFVRAFTWLRWRLLVNAVRAAERRDMVERVSRVTALVAPALLLATSFSAVAAAIGLGAIGGWTLGSPGAADGTVILVVRGVLLVATVFAACAPLFVGMHGGGARSTRLLLLPIPPQTLHFTEVITNLLDPWMVFVGPGLASLGLAILAARFARPFDGPDHRVIFGVAALAAGLGVVAALASLGALVAFLVSWIVRDRRRSEVFVVLLVLALAVASVLPAIVSSRLTVTAGGARAFPDSLLPAWTSGLPSELYGKTMVRAKLGEAFWWPLLGLWMEAVALYTLSAIVHRRLIDSPEQGRVRRHQTAAHTSSFSVPGLWPGTSAVALAQARTAMRSVRGRLVVLLPGPVVAMLSVLLRSIGRSGGGITWHAQGHLLLGGGVILGLYAAQPFTMNQFGSDRAGLTLQFLAPIRDVDVVRGKAVGCGVIIGAGALLTLACAWLTAPTDAVPRWLATLAAGASTYLLLTPLAAWFSMLLPVASDVSKTGTGGNPHTLAMLAGMMLVIVASAPAALMLFLLTPMAALAATLAWLAVTGALSTWLLGVSARVLRRRRENLVLIAQGR
jgi:hypothetical protein